MKEKMISNPYVVEHIQVLEEYFNVQKELFEALKEEPADEFELNSYRVRVMELDAQMEKLGARLSGTIVNLGKIGI